MIIYDCEIIRAIPSEKEPVIKGIDYCKGWKDFFGMGISVICCYDYDTELYRVFLKDNFNEFSDLVDSTDLVIGFNSINFDNKLCEAQGINIPEEISWDLMRELMKSAGTKSHSGFSLNACAKVNLHMDKTNKGANAPVLWQRGKFGTVIDYCLSDVYITKRLVDIVIENESLINPKNTYRSLHIDSPYNRMWD